ncbi:MAG: response regulator [Desulfobacteraceae bacterium]|nr:MAG: response regulator [Desulfobacteraceae bacterium]
MKILVVDDEGIVLSSCRRILEADGFEVVMAASVDEALRVLGAGGDNLPALLLIDVKMPVHDGMYLMQKVKAKHPQMPVIVMSGYPTEETVQTAGHFGAATFIAKPFTPEELLDTVRTVAEKGKRHE